MPEEGTEGTVETTTEGASDAELQKGQGQGKQETAPSLEEALAELERTRAALKKANSEAAERRVKLSQMEADEEKRKLAEMTELQKAQSELAKLQEQHDGLNLSYTNLLMRQAFYDEAGAQNLVFCDDQARRDAYALIDVEGVEVGDDGKVTGMAEAVKALQKTRPYLFGQAKAQEIDAGKTGKTKGKGAEVTDEEVELFAAKYGIKAENVDREQVALALGR